METETDDQILERLNPTIVPDTTYERMFAAAQKRKLVIREVLEHEQLEDALDDDSEDPHFLSSLPEDFDYSQDKSELTNY